MAHAPAPDGSSISARRRSRGSPRSRTASRGSWSAGRKPVHPTAPAGPISLTPSVVRALAARHGIHPKKSLGQHFLIEPRLAQRVVELAGLGPGARVVEVGAGLGSLTVALARSGARVVALEFDRALLPALDEAVAPFGDVRVVAGDARSLDWDAVLDQGPWAMVANLPYNVAVPVIMRILDEAPQIDRMLVMVQREVGERLAAGPGQEHYGAVSVRVAYLADARVVRRVSPTVFWPRPKVESVLVQITRRPPPVSVDRESLWTVVRAAFEQRRKTMRGAMSRLGMDPAEAEAGLAECGVDPLARPETLGLEAFACIAERWRSRSAERKR